MTCRAVWDGECVISDLRVARSTRARMQGLLGRSGLPNGSGLLIDPCSSIHTWFMRFAIDVFFLDGQRTVVKVARNVGPFRMVLGGVGARAVIEVAAGWLTNDALAAGQRIVIEDIAQPAEPSR